MAAREVIIRNHKYRCSESSLVYCAVPFLATYVREVGLHFLKEMRRVESVFANICVRKHMDRFTLRSKHKVDVQWELFALVHNIGKIHMFGVLI